MNSLWKIDFKAKSAEELCNVFSDNESICMSKLMFSNDTLYSFGGKYSCGYDYQYDFKKEKKEWVQMNNSRIEATVSIGKHMDSELSYYESISYL